MTRRFRMPRAVVAVATLACVTLAGSASGPTETDAAWTDAEVASSGLMTAGTVTRVTNLTCTAGLLQPVRFNWPLPVGGLNRTSYRWVVTGGLSGSGTILNPNATTLTVDTGLVGLGSGVFSLYAVEAGGWESLAATANISFISVVLNLTSTCDPT